MRRHILILCFVSFLLNGLLYGQVAEEVLPSDSTFATAPRLVRDLEHFLRVGGDLVTAPLRFTGHQWSEVGLVLGSTAAMFTVDPVLRDLAERNQTEFNDHLFNMDAYWGDKYTFTFSWVLYGGGYLFKQDNIRIMGLHSLEAFLYAGTLTHFLKNIFGRRRPYGGENHLVFKPFKGEMLYRSLPSGHATGAFAVSTVMAKSLDNIWWKGFWYGVAGLVGASRLYHGAHWFSDVFLGSLVGYSVANFIVKDDRTREKVLSSPTVRFRPYLGLSGIGFQVAF